MTLEFPTNAPGGQLCLSVKVWFNEVSNQYDSMYYQNLDDRYALVPFCTRAPESSGGRSRLNHNRVATVDEFKQALGKPFVLERKPKDGRQMASNHVTVLQPPRTPGADIPRIATRRCCRFGG